MNTTAITIKKWGLRVVVTLTVLAVLTAITYGILMRPLMFERHYLSQASELLDVRAQAERNNIFIGASTDDLSSLTSSHFTHSFNSTTPTNLLKLGHLLDDADTLHYDFSAADTFVNQAINGHHRVRGHTLVWGRLSDTYQSPNLQRWLDQFSTTEQQKEKLQNLLDNHLVQVLTQFKGRIHQWDVVNEPLKLLGNGEFEDDVFYRYFGEHYIEWAFNRAHELDPSLKLFINEQLHNYTSKKAQAFYTLVARLVKQGVPIHGVGLQHHMLFFLESPEATRAYLAKFATLGIKVEITELDARLRLFKNENDPYKAQGEYYRDIVGACLDVSACSGVTFWGVNDKDSWHDELGYMFAKPNEPYLFDENNIAKPGVALLYDLLNQQL
ncbi:endo-1,4-beta-xylanase [Teredinibacter purpureus]|uniref:endo-1,4-beta-xylanase n=1 Tax=Teredinibacter purpureus TaxID=2731756 RepID=UPI0005F88038|nr:endo-1,4-beta-xylanase [Teredinibacter purpureus]